jgi:hypothetical protein
MVGTVWLGTVIQRRLNRLATTRQALGTGALALALVTTVTALAGQFGAGTALPFSPHGSNSMNLRRSDDESGIKAVRGEHAEPSLGLTTSIRLKDGFAAPPWRCNDVTSR